jgi:octaprenyl-diphosphate synthase
MNQPLETQARIDAQNEVHLSHELKQTFGRIVLNLPGLEAVAKKVSDSFTCESSILLDTAGYLFSLGGKRLRPVFTILMAQSFSLNPEDHDLVQIAAGIELIHLATLLHDDIIDNSTLRRNAPSPLVKFGMPATLLTGDFLLVRAFGLCAQLDKEIINATEEACVNLVEGEISEGSLTDSIPTIDDYINQIAAKKTAALFALGAFAAGHLAGLTIPEKNLLRDVGRDLGISFQILDDILDVTSNDQVLGKAIGTDIRERKPSIINILWLQSGSQLAQKLLQSPILQEPHQEDQFIKLALSELNSQQPSVDLEQASRSSGEFDITQHAVTDPISVAREIATYYANRAKDKFNQVKKSSSLTDHANCANVELLIDYTLNRLY